MIKAVLFDLDGTLADTALDLAGTLNDLLRQKGLPEKKISQIRPYAAHGSAALIHFGTGIAENSPEFPRWQEEYLNHYAQRYAQDTILFEGVNTVLLALAQKKIRWGIVTNKHQRFTQPLVARLDFATPPDVVVSGDTCAQAKPNPEPLFYACRQLKLAPECCLYVGDAQRDIEAGRRAGMKTALAKWGYLGENDNPKSWEADFQAAKMTDILTLLS